MEWSTIVDDRGVYRGIVPKDLIPKDCIVVPEPPPTADHVWQDSSWVIPAPLVISDQQLASEMKSMGLITQAERLALVGPGTMPAVFVTALSLIKDEDHRDDVEASLTGMVAFDRSSPVVQELFGLMNIDIEEFFMSAGSR